MVETILFSSVQSVFGNNPGCDNKHSDTVEMSKIDTNTSVRLEALLRRMVCILRSFDAGKDYDAWALASGAADNLEQTAGELADMNKGELCKNCGCRLPLGCDGFFQASDGDACALNRRPSERQHHEDAGKKNSAPLGVGMEEE